MQEFIGMIEQNAFIILIAVTGLFGCVAFNMAGKGITVLCNETASMTTSKHPFIKQIKLRRENGMRINVNVSNTYAFVQKNMERYKYLNLPIRDYLKMAWLVQLLCVMLGLVGGVINGNVWYTAYGCVCAIAISCVGRIEDVERKEQQVVINIVDYFDNILTFDKKVVETEPKEDYNKNDMQADTVAEAKKVNESQVAAISEEQRQLIEEVLKEYLA